MLLESLHYINFNGSWEMLASSEHFTLLMSFKILKFKMQSIVVFQFCNLRLRISSPYLLNTAEKLSQNNKPKPNICQILVVFEKSNPYCVIESFKTAQWEEGNYSNIFQFASIKVFSHYLNFQTIEKKFIQYLNLN